VIGRTISHYKILEKLGEGGMGTVYKAEDTRLDRIVALKFLSPDALESEADRERFVNEAKAAAALNHPGICTVYDISEEAGQFFIAMEYVESRTLKEQIASGPLAVEEAVDVATQIAEVLQEVHGKGILHRDIKPGNILVGSRGRVKLSDFGLAKFSRASSVSEMGKVFGTVAYMSPEQTGGEELDARSDIWSLGVVLYEMLAGARPFEGDYDGAIVYSILNVDPEAPAAPGSDISPELQRVALKSLEKERDMRYASAAGFLEDLKRAVAGEAAGDGDDRVGELKPSIAVIPFANMSADEDQEYFCDGLADEIINALAHLEGLRVVSRSSAFAFKGKTKDIREIGGKLNVGTVLEGSVRRSGEKVRITAQLVNVDDGFQLWSGKFDRDLEDIFAIQDEISMAIVGSLKPRLLIGEKDKVVERHTLDVDAYNHYLRGRWFWDKRTGESLEKAIDYFKLAVERDPGYAQAYAGIADSYNDLPTYGLHVPSDVYSKAKEAALKAIEVDPSHAEPHASLGLIKTDYEWDWEGAEREFRRAIELNPTYSSARHWYAVLLMWIGRYDEAVEEINRALELDPLNLVINRSTGMILSCAGRSEGGFKALERTLELDPNFVYTHLLMGHAHLRLRNLDKALDEFMLERNVSGTLRPYVESWIGIALALLGKAEEARDILHDILDVSRTSYVPSFQIGMLHLVLGELDRGFELFDRAYKERDIWMRSLKVRQPFFPEHVRNDPRMAQVLAKMKMD
jgi:serine/threonine protein kinase/Tfp pilus assembly protein PilF